jgi:opacity protein-like surface antigen
MRMVIFPALLIAALPFPWHLNAQQGQPTGPRFLVEVYGGVSTFGHFLEQRVGGTSERELTATTGFPLSERGRFAPYTLLGVAGGWWSLDEGEEGAQGVVLTGEDDTQFRFGGVGGLGIQVRATPRVVIRLEAAQYRLGNPFDGDDAWRLASGTTFDEPETVRISRYALGLAFSVGGR